MHSYMAVRKFGDDSSTGGATFADANIKITLDCFILFENLLLIAVYDVISGFCCC